MSRPKIGSVTAVAGRARTAPGGHRAGPSPRPPTTEPPMTSAMSTATRAEGRRRRAASGRAGRRLEDDASAGGVRRTGRGRRRSATPGAVRAASAAWAAVVEPVDERAGCRARPRRPAAARAGRRARGCRAGRRGRATKRRGTGRPGPPSRVQKTRSKPTLRNHSASVHRSSPKLNSRKSAMTTTMTTPRPIRRPGRAARPDPPSSRPARGRGAGGGRRCGGAAAIGCGRSAVLVGARRRPRVVVGGGRRSPSSAVVVVRVASSGASPLGRRSGRASLAARRRLAPAELLQEVVEQVAHRRRGVYAGRIGSGPVEPLDGTAGTPPGPSRRARSGASWRRARARTGRPPGPPAGRATAGRVLGRGDRRAASGAGRRPRGSARTARRRSPGPRRASGGSGGGPPAGATSRKLTTPSSSATHRIGQPPAVGRLGRPAHAGAQRAVADADLCSRRNDGPGGGRRSGTAAG